MKIPLFVPAKVTLHSFHELKKIAAPQEGRRVGKYEDFW